MSELMRKICVFFEMIKFEHTIFALPFAYMGLFLAESTLPRPGIFLWVTAAMVTFRTMAMGANRLLDAGIDALNPRTRLRAIPAGKLSHSVVWAATLVSLVLFECSAYALGSLCFRLSLVPLLLAWLYPLCKRFTWLSHFVLGIILGIAPYGGWIASRGDFSWTPGFLMMGVTFWVSGFDIIYSLQDETFDRSKGLFSFPARFGSDVALKSTQALHVAALFCWAAVGVSDRLGVVYFGGILLSAAMLIREHWLLRKFGLGKIQQAFFTMNAFISMTLFAATVIEIL